ncbi:uncharacterized protein LOC126910457 [Daktulosphaira vitifoliae]|uniref:uncharacterized protein LOC126910457 n=1 Tax=Daktulosphaira vitifoliae TaxID=58002 RepID=UPI0021AA27A5|nr:uncharacterized protein LOC126910457 [Daktulosphaira vitifoliae]
MHLGLVLVCVILGSFDSISSVDGKLNKNEYALYFKYVTNTIRHQNVWKTLQHLKIINAHNNMIEIQDLFESNLKNTSTVEMTDIFYIISDLLNYLFAEVLKIFSEHMRIIIEDCEQFFNRNLTKYSVNCTMLLLKAAKSSNVMFEHLYKIINFIEYIDVKFVTRNSLENQNIVYEDMYTVKEFTYLLESPDILEFSNNDGSPEVEKAKKMLTKIENFIEKTAISANDILNKCSNIVDYSIKSNWREKYNNEFVNKKYKTMIFVDFIIQKLDVYYMEIITKYYYNMGFNVLLNRSLVELTHHQSYEFCQKESIEKFNALLQNGNWELLNNISIKYGNKLITINRILRDMVDDFNCNLKKKYFTQLLRCRYTKVLAEYDTYMSTIIEICRSEKSRNCLDRYIDCVIQFFHSVKESKIMLSNMLLALDTLKITTIWEVNNNSSVCLSLTHQVLSNFLSKIEKMNIPKIDSTIKPKYVGEIIANDLIIVFQNSRKYFTKSLKNYHRIINKYCQFNNEHNQEEKLINSLKEKFIENIYNRCNYLYQFAINQFTNFFSEKAKSEYEDLGFKKISNIQ